MKRNWYACELHCHTCHSDGKFTPEELMHTAAERLLDGIALTDHNTMSAIPHAAACEKPVLLPGVEMTTYHGHMPVLNPSEWVEWRDVPVQNGDLLVSRAKAVGGLVGIAHPFHLGTPVCTGGHWDYTVQDMSKVNYIELWSEGCPFINSSNTRAIAYWHACLDQGLHLTPTMGRDWHRAENNAYPAACTYLGSTAEELCPEAMLNAVEKGRTILSAGPRFTFETKDGFTVGDTVAAGTHTLQFAVDYSRNDILNADTPVACRKLIVRTNGEKILKELETQRRFTELTVDVTLQPASWMSVELWGEIGEKENQLIAVTAAMYAV